MSIHNPVKRLFLTLTEGVYVIGVGEGGLGNAFTATSVMQASMRPPLLAVAVNPENASYPLIVARGVFCVTVLQRDQRALADFFGNHSARDENKLRAVRWHAAPSGTPVLDEGLAYFDCQVMAKHPAGDHVVILAEVTGGDLLQKRAPPLRYDELGNMDGSDELLPDHLGASSEIHDAHKDE
ncbi:MAG: flavin reductase family protein [Thiobacillus sp.]|nr:flavin reductase family protein [Thiobacillus sp.]